MDQFLGPPIDIDQEVSRINDELELHFQRVEELETQRDKLLTRKKDLDMDIALDCILKNNFTSNEIMALVIEAAEKRKTAC